VGDGAISEGEGKSVADDALAGRRVTSADVAREAGVSRATVSYILNGTGNQPIRESTRRRVLDAARTLGYTPSAAARTLRRGRSDLVVCLLPDFPMGPTLGGFLHDLTDCFTARSMTFVIYPIPDGASSARLWKALSPAALIALAPFRDEDAELFESLGLPVAEVVYGTVHHKLPQVILPNNRFGRLQAEYLAGRGHQRLGYAYPDDARLALFAEPRLAGVRQACLELNLPAPVTCKVGWDPDSAGAALRAWLGAEVPATAVCAYNDEVALALLSAAREMGIGVPGDLAVIGVDDIPLAVLGRPALTTVSTNLRPYAEQLAELIVAAVNGKYAPCPAITEQPRVVVRDST
jgi:DNA-binding LacI/PurR family transcriptional regulator